MQLHAVHQRRCNCTREFPAQRRSSLTACRVSNVANRVVWIRSAPPHASLAVGPRQSVEKVRHVHVLSQSVLQLPGPLPLNGRLGQREGSRLPAKHPQTALQLSDIPCPKPRCYGSPSHRGLPVSTLPHLDASMKPRLIRVFRSAPEHPLSGFSLCYRHIGVAWENEVVSNRRSFGMRRVRGSVCSSVESTFCRCCQYLPWSGSVENGEGGLPYSRQDGLEPVAL